MHLTWQMYWFANNYFSNKYMYRNEESSIFFYFEKKKNLMSADNNKLPKHRK